MKNYKRGLTLLEILLVIAAISILSGIVVLVLNPSKQLGDTRNAQRRSDVNTILNAVYQYAIDHEGKLPAGIDDVVGTSQVLGTATSGLGSGCFAATTVDAGLDLSTDLVPVYLVNIPFDPKNGTNTNTNYYINKDAVGRITVGACNTEHSLVINVTR